MGVLKDQYLEIDQREVKIYANHTFYTTTISQAEIMLP